MLSSKYQITEDKAEITGKATIAAGVGTSDTAEALLPLVGEVLASLFLPPRENF